MYGRIEEQTGKKLSRVEKELIAIDCLDCIELNAGKLDELQKERMEVCRSQNTPKSE